jgi:hypothetical protein
MVRLAEVELIPVRGTSWYYKDVDSTDVLLRSTVKELQFLRRCI